MSSKREELPLPKPVDIHRAIAEAVAHLQPLGDEFVLIGGVALGAYGIERFTKDVDLACTVAQTAAAERSLASHAVKPLRIGGISLETAAGVRVDLIDRRFDYRGLFEEAIQVAKEKGGLVRVGTVELPVVTLPYLVAMKLIADRPQDEIDLLALLRLDALPYKAARDVVHRWVGPYAAGRLDKLARSVGRADAPPDYSREPS